MKIYTKTGDKGTTSLIGGTRVPKYDDRIEAYGTVDELMAFTALLMDESSDEEYRHSFITILDRLMTCASILATDCTNCKVEIPEITDDDILVLEQQIDQISQQTDPLKSFILPGGHRAVSTAHVARTICRRAERITLKVAEQAKIPENVIKYLNRLSDFFFMYSLFLAKKLRIEQITWNPRI